MRDFRSIVNIIGILLCIESIAMLIPMFYDLYFKNDDWLQFLYSSLITFFIGIILYLIVFLYSIKKNISFEEKCFLIPFIITQSLRGAGYYNGGFALIFIILLISYFASFKETK